MFFIDRVTLFFTNNSLTDCQVFFFLDPEVIFSSHTMFIYASTKEFTHINSAIPSYDTLRIALEHLLNYKMVANVD